jgi:hypothetical protein
MTRQFAITYIDGTTEIVSSGDMYLLMIAIAECDKGDKVIKIEELEFWKRDDYDGE